MGKIKISRLTENNLNQLMELVELFNEVFDEPHTLASEQQLKELLNKPDFHALASIKDDTVVGGLTAYELKKYHSDKSELYIYDIAVKPQFQNQGIGKNLIGFLKEYAMKNEIETIFVEAHSKDEDAVRFYKSTFGESEKVDLFSFNIKTKDYTPKS